MARRSNARLKSRPTALRSAVSWPAPALLWRATLVARSAHRCRRTALRWLAQSGAGHPRSPHRRSRSMRRRRGSDTRAPPQDATSAAERRFHRHARCPTESQRARSLGRQEMPRALDQGFRLQRAAVTRFALMSDRVRRSCTWCVGLRLPGVCHVRRLARRSVAPLQTLARRRGTPRDGSRGRLLRLWSRRQQGLRRLSCATGLRLRIVR